MALSRINSQIRLFAVAFIFGDLQYDDGAYCRDDVFIDDIQNERYSGYKIFAFRMILEGGVATCIDNGCSFSVLPYGHTIYQFGYIFDTGLSGDNKLN